MIAVLNRGGVVDFSFLTHSEKFPYLHAICHHKGLKIVEEKEVQKIFGVSSATAGVVGLVVTALSLFFAYQFFPSVGWASLWAFLLGSVAALIGAGCVWLWRLLLRILR